jgi:tyrosine-specific transport protein
MFILNKIIGCLLLISGTSIGAGMLGLPVSTLGINFYIIVFVFLIIWIIILISSLSMLEISLWIKDDINIISISKLIFGKNFTLFLSLVYILFFYSLISAYIVGGTSMLIDLIHLKNSNFIYNYISIFFLISLFSIILIFGIKFSDYINRFFFILLILLYIFLLLSIKNISYLNIDNLKIFQSRLILITFPIIVTSFGYSLLIPSLKKYLFSNYKILIISIIIGSLIPFIVYLIWEYFFYMFLINTENKFFLQTLFGYGNPSEKIILIFGNNNKLILLLISLFSIFALFSSLLGVSLGLNDFFFDIFKIDKLILLNKLLINILVFFIPSLLSLIYPYGFMFFLSYAGIFASFLLILFPIYTLWYGRYIFFIKYKFILFKTEIFFYIIIFFGFFIIFTDLFYKISI